ncbi:hypothetical protein [Tessaracoccus flavus]|uniref:Uncharacterized protein n=1 Tax=Tessaracoccus flavus TaxID=1610493 RepID=A0A1Q2CGY8_9ACTN|nr:hypothetical protein [Tessaracoccus flavus]AQP45381.1 hypothetical protein RPIT_11705 [Tessaracoccus flavus]SDY93620.1 hypothetical protein SAMN05428934_106134 [Tessaracoccus flavus]
MAKRPKRHQLKEAGAVQAPVDDAVFGVDEDDEIDLAFDAEDPLLEEFIRDMSLQTCDYCASPVQWIEPEELIETYPAEVDDVLFDLDLDVGDILMSWVCTECPNFSIIGEDFESQYLDIQGDVPCLECEATTQAIDPAQASHLDREGYLKAKREFGAQAVLDGYAQRCPGCGNVDYYPAGV